MNESSLVRELLEENLGISPRDPFKEGLNLLLRATLDLKVYLGFFFLNQHYIEGSILYYF
jgi:hypothetical protein